MNLHTPIVPLLAGIILLSFGRRLFWLLVGVLGFLAGMSLAGQYLHGQTEMVRLFIALMAGILGTILAIILQKAAIIVAGFIAGAYFVSFLMTAFSWNLPQLVWLPLLIGGVIGAVFGIVLFDWALIVISSITGAMLVTQSFHVHRPAEGILLLVLVIAGIVIQSRFTSKQPAKRSS